MQWIDSLQAQSLLNWIQIFSSTLLMNWFPFQYLSRHLYRVSLRGGDTGMTAKNVAIVWAPNLLRSKSLEMGGVAALQGVGVQVFIELEFNIKIHWQF